MATQLGLPGIPLGGGISGALQGLLGSQAVRSIAEWMMLQNLVQALEGPLTAELGQTAFDQFPTLVSSPVELAAGVVRGHIPESEGFKEAKKSGYDKAPFRLLLDNAGQPLPLQALMEAWRRGLIPEAGLGGESVALEQGIRESDLKNKWTPVVKGLQWQLLTPADVVAAWVRGHLVEAEALRRGRLAGVQEEDLRVLHDNAGQPLPLQALMEAWRRGLIPEAGLGGESVALEQGIRESDLKNKWTPVVKGLQWQLLTPADVVAAWVRSQISEAEALRRGRLAGVQEEDLRVLHDTTGSPPGPAELADMANRGIIPWEGVGPQALSFQQGIYEGDTKNKWLDPKRAAAAYLPPPRTVTALLRAGSITDELALSLFKQAGLPQELAAAYVADAHHQKTQATRELTKADILTLYQDRLMDKATALSLLESLHYDAQDAGLELAAVDFRQVKALLDHALSRLHSLYLSRKLDESAVLAAMKELGAPPTEVAQLLQTWKVERAASVQVLSAAEICDAVFYTLLSVEEGLAQLEAKGFSPQDAWIRLGVRLHGPPTAARPAGVLPAG